MCYFTFFITKYNGLFLRINLLTLIFFFIFSHLNAQILKVSNNKRHLVNEDGRPFFYLGDTAWELFHRLNREEASEYLINRAEKGFNVIQAVVLAELDGLNTPNAYGHIPLKDNDPAQPEEAYFEHVDFIVNKAEELEIFIGMLPNWGDKFNPDWGGGPEIFTPENAKKYGEFLGKRYANKPIIWILGGDRIPSTDSQKAIVRAMAEGIKKGDKGKNLMTYHPMGENSSSQFFQEESWLDFNMFQSGHGKLNAPNYQMTINDLKLNPLKPTLDGEPRYEDHPVNWKPELGRFDAYDVRQAAYWSVLAGAMGHTYGNHNIWQMWQPERTPISFARTPWKDAMDQPGAYQVGYLRNLLESRPFGKLVPEQSIIMGHPGSEMEHARAALAEDGSFSIIYLPTGKSVNLKMSKIGKSKVKAWWFDPRTGTAEIIGEYVNLGVREFDPPGEPGRDNDWVLILEDASKNFPVPGYFN
ncbi:glycoside hydrolase family 140 protein [soil metagenome]